MNLSRVCKKHDEFYIVGHGCNKCYAEWMIYDLNAALQQRLNENKYITKTWKIEDL